MPDPNQRLSLAALTLTGILLAPACGSDATEPVILHLTAALGNDQVAPVGTTLPIPLEVVVTSGGGKPVPGITISWSVEEGGGSLTPGSPLLTTDGSGRARVSRLLGPVAGLQTTIATIVGQGGLQVRFNAIAHVQGATQMEVHPSQADLVREDTVLATLAIPHRVVVRNHEGQPVAGVVVEWSVPNGGGTLSSTSTSTDSDGTAAVTQMLGPRVGLTLATASVPGLVGSPVSFATLARPGTPAVLGASKGDGGLVLITTGIVFYTARVMDAHGNGISGFPVEWSVLPGAGTIDPWLPTTTIEGATASHTLAPVEGPQTAVATAGELPGAPQVSFTTTVVHTIVSLLPRDEYSCWYDGLCTPHFSPQDVVVPLGGSVGWTWSTNSPCDVVFEDVPSTPVSSRVQTTGRHVRTFHLPGTYRYRCTLQSSSFTSGMVGVVRVE